MPSTVISSFDTAAMNVPARANSKPPVIAVAYTTSSDADILKDEIVAAIPQPQATDEGKMQSVGVVIQRILRSEKLLVEPLSNLG